MFRLGLPKRPRRLHLGHHLARPDSARVHVGDGPQRRVALGVSGEVDARAVGQAKVVALPVQRGWVVDLEEEFQYLAERQSGGVKDHLDPFGMCPVVAVGGVGHIAAGIADAGGHHTGDAPDQILHPPKTPACQNRGFGRVGHDLHPLRSAAA